MEDNLIVDLYFARSQDAIAETAAKYGGLCYSIAYNILKNSEDSDECVNDTYMRAWNSIPPTKPNRLSAFLGRITRNLALDRYDYNTAGKRNTEMDDIMSELNQCIASPETVEDAVEEKLVASLISKWLRTQEPLKRNVFIRRYWYSDSMEALSQRFGISQGRVKSMLFRMREALKIYLKKEGVAI